MQVSKELNQLSVQKIYSRNEILQIFQGENENLADSTFRWLLYNLQNDKKLFRVGYDAYTLTQPEILPAYRPIYSEKAEYLADMITGQFPELEFVIFESTALNEFLNHQIAQNTIYLQIEKDVSSFVFDVLQERYSGPVLFKPGEKEQSRYWTKDCVIVLDLISQAPLSSEYPHEMTAEKLLVDIVGEKSIARLFSPAELPHIYDGILNHYQVDTRRINRYAGRRGKSALVKKYLGGEE